MSTSDRSVNDLFRPATEALPFGLYFARALRLADGALDDLEWLFQNAAAAAITGVPAGDAARGVRIGERFPQLRDTPLWAAFGSVLSTGEPWSGEVAFTSSTADRELWFRTTVVRTAPETLCVTFEEITEKKRLEAEKHDEALTNEILLRIAGALDDLDIGRVVQRVTDEATRVCRAQFGAFFYNIVDAKGARYTLYTLAGVDRSAFERFPMPRATEVFAPTFRGDGVVRSSDITNDPRYGKSAPYHGMPPGHLPVRSYLAAPVVSRNGFVHGGLFFGHADVGVFAERDERIVLAIAQQAAVVLDNAALLEEAKRERANAEEANRAKDEFLAVFSHELRTPLNAILGWSGMLRAQRLAPEKTATALESIERNARAQVALIEDVLDVSRIISGKLRLDVAPVDMAEVVSAAVDTLRPAADAKDLRLQVVRDPDAGTTMGDAHRLQQIAWNLLSNAVKFAKKRGRVNVHLYRNESSIVLVVSDDGRGIPREFLPHVFERFRQADASSTRAYGGLGLGLAIVKHLVELHGGSVRAESDGEDKGATFTVSIPVAPLRSSSAPPRPREQGARSLDCPEGIEGLRILVVEDEDESREVLRAILEHCDAKVTVAASVADALAAFRAERPDVVVSDIGMPNEDGYALIKTIRALSPEDGGRTPVVALTAYARAEDRTRALARGFNNHVAKPVEPSELLVVIANLVGRYAT